MIHSVWFAVSMLLLLQPMLRPATEKFPPSVTCARPQPDVCNELDAVAVLPRARLRVTAGPGEGTPGARSTVKLFVKAAIRAMFPLAAKVSGSLM